MKPDKVELKIDWATHEAARFACENWHYSRCLPAGKLVKIGVWEDGKFIGVVLFGRGANNNMAQAYHLEQNEACELVRIALTNHRSPVSRVAAVAMRFLKKSNLGIRLIISYADPKQGHHGGIYQAGNWIYCGASKAQRQLLINGISMHKRSVSAKYGTASVEVVRKLSGAKVEWAPSEWKHTYIMPLDARMRERIKPLARAYPKRAGSDTKDTAGFQSAKGGSTPTPALQ